MNTFRARKTETGPLRLGLGAVLAALLAGCTVLPPTQELSDARQTLKAARAAQADRYAGFYLWEAESHLLNAQQELEKGRHAYGYARFHALQARQAAVRAHQLASAFDNARSALQEAAAIGYLWRDSEELLAQAQKAAAAHDFETALALARQAQMQGEAAQVQRQVEQARFAMQRDSLPESTLPGPSQLDILNKIKANYPGTVRQEIIPGVLSEQ